MLSALLDLVFAPVCLGCDSCIAPGDSARLVCRRCRTRLRTPPPPCCARCGAPLRATGRRPQLYGCPDCAPWPESLSLARAACLLQPPADRLVHQLKYRGWRALAEPVAKRMASVSMPADVMRETEVCVPVPTTPRRLRERGYHQAECIARSFARRTGRDVRLVLERVGDASSQTALQAAARKANVASAFSVRSGERLTIRNAHLLLVDDVLTTGATAIECATTLVLAGARCVSLITFARALDSRRLAQT